MSTFQDNLKSYRERLGINAKDFAAQIGVNYSTYSNYENQGREPKYDTLCKIAAALHVSIDELLGYKVDKLAYLLNRLGDNFEFIESSTPGKVILRYWPQEGIPPIEVEYDRDELTALLESCFENAGKIAALPIREIAERDVYANMQLKKNGVLPINLSVDVERKIKSPTE